MSHDREPLAPSQTAVEPVVLAQALKNLAEGAEQEDREILYAAASALTEQTAAREAAEKERDEARDIVRSIYWMAVRYADGRKSYAPGMCNDALRKAYDGGWLAYRDDKQHDLDPQYARDGDRPEYRSIEARAESAERSLAEMREALRPFVEFVPTFDPSIPDSEDSRGWTFQVGHFRRARSALGEKKNG